MRPSLRVDRHGPVTVVTIDRPERRNAVDRRTADEPDEEDVGIDDEDGGLVEVDDGLGPIPAACRRSVQYVGVSSPAIQSASPSKWSSRAKAIFGRMERPSSYQTTCRTPPLV